jgi:hypothetical protein
MNKCRQNTQTVGGQVWRIMKADEITEGCGLRGSHQLAGVKGGCRSKGGRKEEMRESKRTRTVQE